VGVGRWQGSTHTATARLVRTRTVAGGCSAGEYDKEQSSYYMQTSQWCDIPPDQILGQPAVIKSFDLNTCTLDDIKVLNESFALKIDAQRDEPDDDRLFPRSNDVQVAGFCGWFDVHFRVSTARPRHP
jgi:protein arginine N-methyltransferase 1